MEQDIKCPRCGDSFKRKENLIAHLKRKTECPSTVSDGTRQSFIDALTTKQYNEKTYDCQYCNKKFNLASCKSRHKKICKKNPTNIQEPLQDEASTSQSVQDTNGASTSTNFINTDGASTSQVVLDREDFELMKQELKELKELKVLMQELVASSKLERNTTNNVSTNNSNNNNNTNNTNNTINIHLNTFGNESTSHLTKEFLSYCILNPKKGMASLIESIHYNKSIPENQNLRCKSLKQNVFEKYTEDEWRACDASNTLDELIRKGYRILNSHYADNIINQPDFYDDEQKQRAYEKFRFLSDVTSNDYFAVKRELRILVKDRTMYLLASPDTNDAPINNNENTLNEPV